MTAPGNVSRETLTPPTTASEPAWQTWTCTNPAERHTLARWRTYGGAVQIRIRCAKCQEWHTQTFALVAIDPAQDNLRSACS